jgi:hypothetical protein
MKPIAHHTIASIWEEAFPLRAVHHVPLDDTLMVVTDDVLLTASVLRLKLVLGLAPNAVLDLEALLTAAICPEISEKNRICDEPLITTCQWPRLRCGLP